MQPQIQHKLFIFAILVSFLLLLPIGLRADDDDEKYRGSREHVMEEVSESLGTISLWGLILFNGLYYYCMAFKRVPKGFRTHAPEIAKQPLKWKTKFRKFHYWGNPVVIALAFLHGWWAEKTHPVLWWGWGILVFLMISGIIMKLQKADQPGAKVNRLIHTQHFFSIAMLVLLLVGHGLVD